MLKRVLYGLLVGVFFFVVSIVRAEQPCESFTILEQIVSMYGKEVAPGVVGVELSYETPTGIVMSLKGGIGGKIGAIIMASEKGSERAFAAYGVFYDPEEDAFAVVDFVMEEWDNMSREAACNWMQEWVNLYRSHSNISSI